jgi:hypothetical protein
MLAVILGLPLGAHAQTVVGPFATPSHQTVLPGQSVTVDVGFDWPEINPPLDRFSLSVSNHVTLGGTANPATTVQVRPGFGNGAVARPTITASALAGGLDLNADGVASSLDRTFVEAHFYFTGGSLPGSLPDLTGDSTVNTADFASYVSLLWADRLASPIAASGVHDIYISTPPPFAVPYAYARYTFVVPADASFGQTITMNVQTLHAAWFMRNTPDPLTFATLGPAANVTITVIPTPSAAGAIGLAALTLTRRRPTR